MRARGLVAVGMAALCVLLAAPAAAGATPTWLAPMDASGPVRNQSPPRIAVDADGNAIAVWSRAPGQGGSIVEAAVRPAGGIFGAPVEISAPGQGGFDPDIAVDRSGNALVVWLRRARTGSVVQAAAANVRGFFGSPADLSPAGLFRTGPAIALSDTGDFAAVWSRQDLVANPRAMVEAAVRAGGGFGPAIQISAPGEFGSDPRIAMDASGEAVVAWLGGAARGVQVAERPAGGAFGPPVTVSALGVTAVSAEVAVRAGRAVVAWSRREPAASCCVVAVQAARRAAGGPFAAPADISPPTALPSPFDGIVQVGLDDAGGATVVWQDGNPALVRAAEGAAGGSFGAPQTLSAPGPNALDPQLAVGPQGNAVAVWRRSDGTVQAVQAGARAAGGSFGAPQEVSGPGPDALGGFFGLTADPQVALDGSGNATAIWLLRGQAANVVQSAVYDATGPALTGVSVPQHGTVGVPLLFEAAAADTWTPIAGVDWSFGDGTGANGSGVAHVYRAPGDYPVTVTATDAVGNATSVSRTVQIGPAATVASGALESLSITRRRFARGRSRTAPTATVSQRRVPVGTTIAYRLSQAATVTLRFQRARSGRRSRGRCVRPTSALRRRARCTRYVTAATVRRMHRAGGAKRVAFSGRVGRRALALGRHRLHATARTGTGPVSAARTVSFTIVRR